MCHFLKLGKNKLLSNFFVLLEPMPKLKNFLFCSKLTIYVTVSIQEASEKLWDTHEAKIEIFDKISMQRAQKFTRWLKTVYMKHSFQGKKY